MNYKTLPQFTKQISDRTVTGIFAVHGNIDDGGDRSWPGSFRNTEIGGRDRTVFLWQHNSMEPPVAVIKAIRELSRDQLPASVLAYAPDATGAVEVARDYLDTPRGNEILTGLKAGAIDEMSYAYEVARYDFETIDGRQIRNLRELKLYDISDVNWGLNPATLGVKAGLVPGLPFDVHSLWVVSAVEEWMLRAKSRTDARTKEGRVLSEANRKRIADAVTVLQELLELTAPKAVPADPAAPGDTAPPPDGKLLDLFTEHRRIVERYGVSPL